MASSGVTQVEECNTQQELDAQLTAAGDKLVCVYFTAPWCGPCKLTGKSLEAIAAEETEVLFLKVDGSVLEEAVERFHVTVMPTFCFVKKGKALELYVGGKLDTFRDTIVRMKSLPAS